MLRRDGKGRAYGRRSSGGVPLDHDGGTCGVPGRRAWSGGRDAPRPANQKRGAARGAGRDDVVQPSACIADRIRGIGTAPDQIRVVVNRLSAEVVVQGEVVVRAVKSGIDVENLIGEARIAVADRPAGIALAAPQATAVVERRGTGRPRRARPVVRDV